MHCESVIRVHFFDWHLLWLNLVEICSVKKRSMKSIKNNSSIPCRQHSSCLHNEKHRSVPMIIHATTSISTSTNKTLKPEKRTPAFRIRILPWGHRCLSQEQVLRMENEDVLEYEDLRVSEERGSYQRYHVQGHLHDRHVCVSTDVDSVWPYGPMLSCQRRLSNS